MRIRADKWRRQRGFTLLELIVVVIVVVILVLTAIRNLLPLRIEAERVAVLQVVGGLRSALGIEVAHRVVHGGLAEIARLAGSNPMDRLAQTPDNYLGALEEPDPATIPPGSWYFDRDQGVLVYRVRWADALLTSLEYPARIRYRIDLVFTDLLGDGRYDPAEDALHGVRLVAAEPWQWQAQQGMLP